MKKVLLGIAGAGALVLSTASLAGGPDVTTPVAPTQQTGFYASVGAGYGYQDARVFSRDSAFSSYSNTKDGFAWIASIGYQFSPYFAAELGYFKLPDIKTKAAIPALFGYTAKGKSKADAVYMAGKGIIPVSDNFDVFGKAGIARIDESVSLTESVTGALPSISKVAANELVFLGGIGMDYYVTSNLAITVQGLATLKGSHVPATYLATAGVSYKFAV